MVGALILSPVLLLAASDRPRSFALAELLRRTFVRAGFVGMDEKEGSRLLRELCDLLQAEDQLYRHHWRVGDLVVWDNCSTQHRATFDYSWPRHRRLMRRSNVVGTRPV